MPNFDGIQFISQYGVTEPKIEFTTNPVYKQYENRCGYFAYMFIQITGPNYLYPKFLGFYYTEKEAKDSIRKSVKMLYDNDTIKIKEKMDEIDFLLRDIINEKQN